jgi:LysR family transcriptional regulator, glycine cleavage system transcriptional activator
MDRLPPQNALRAFDAAARHLSFQKAAAELHVTPAALSYQIRHLEETLGLKLFNRLNRAVELTEHGQLIRPGIREGFERFPETMRRLARARAGNVLTVSAGPAFTAKWLAPRLYHFISANPDIDVRVSANLAVADLEHDDVDVAVRFGRGTYPRCRATKLADEFVTPLCSPSLLKGRQGIKAPADLAHHALIHDDTHLGFFELASWEVWLKAAGAMEVNPAG